MSLGFGGLGSNVPNLYLAVAELANSPTDYPVVSAIEGLVRSTVGGGAFNVAIGITQGQGIPLISTPMGPCAYDPNNTGNSIPGIALNIAWVIPPTQPSYPFRYYAGSFGNNSPSFALRFTRGIRLAPSTSLVLYTFNSAQSSAWLGEINVEFDA